MKKTLLITLISLLSFSALFAQDEQAKDKDLIKHVIQTAYVDGLCNNTDEAAIKNGFHPGFNLLYAGNGNTLWNLPIHNWIEMAEGGKEKGNKYSFQDEHTTVKFLFIDVTGNIAISKIEFYEGKDLKYIDYLSLIKFNDAWKIISKIAHPVPEGDQ